jgi:hypothetical protein
MARKKAEPNSVYFLKVVLFFILGTIWIRFGSETQTGIGVPVGLMLGVLFANHEHFQIDQKVEFAVLFIAAVLSYIFPIGAVLRL